MKIILYQHVNVNSINKHMGAHASYQITAGAYTRKYVKLGFSKKICETRRGGREMRLSFNLQNWYRFILY
jgi:hypothetical protein